VKRTVWLLAWGIVLLVSRSNTQTVTVFDTVYTPPGNPDGPYLATMFVPALSNGIGAVLVHGSDVDRQTVSGWSDTLAAHGYVTMSIEYPSVFPVSVYPKAARAVKLAVQFLRRNAVRFGITTNKIVGFGGSLGAITWGEAIIWDNDYVYFQTDPTIDDHLNAAILLYGGYGYSFSDPGIRAYFSNDSTRYLKGTCIKHVANITTPVLLMHGTGDQVDPYEGSVQLHDSLVAHGKVSQLVLFPELTHGFDVYFPQGNFTAAGLVAKDTALAFLRRTVAPALRIRLSSSSIDFGALLVSVSDTTTLRVENIGDSTLTLHSISNSHAEYTLLNVPSLPFAIQAGGSTEFQVAFQPVGEGAVDDTVDLESDDPLHPVAKITLHGKGIASVSSAQTGVLYTTLSGMPEGRLLSLNVANGTVDTIGPMGVPEMWAMSIRHSDRMIFGTSITPAPTGIYVISGTSGEAALLRRLPIANLSALAFSPGDTLYGATTTGSLYRIDLASGRMDSLGTSVGLVYSGLSFRPRTGELWASVRYPIDSIFTLNKDDGTATLVGTTGFYALTSSITFDPSGTLYGLIDNGTGEDYLATIDTVTASGSIIAGPLPVTYLRAITLTGDISAVSVKDSPHSSTPLKFTLSQNYPNPFNPTTTIKYELPKSSVVRLSVYDILGREVAVLVNESRNAGGYEVKFDASGLSSGVYCYRLQAGNFVQTKKLLLLR
jgi:acetyl esterase/lipase